MQCFCYACTTPLLLVTCMCTVPHAPKKISGTPLSNNLTRNASKNGNEAYKTQNKFLGMPCDLPNNQQAVTSSTSSAAHGA
jgi:hypothetical protein